MRRHRSHGVPSLQSTPEKRLRVFTIPPWTNYLGRAALLATLYVVTGKLGLLLAVPPGYATIIWPASGIAIGMLLVHGAKLWPAILVGSWLLNAHQSGVFADFAWLSERSFAALCIGIGSTLQALAGRE